MFIFVHTKYKKSVTDIHSKYSQSFQIYCLPYNDPIGVRTCDNHVTDTETMPFSQQAFD